uniref:Uncharacterized protein n=1 Tax=Romanomermis culicivorax TaxID=13658 RepID=A0A915LB04_ROMCU
METACKLLLITLKDNRSDDTRFVGTYTSESFKIDKSSFGLTNSPSFPLIFLVKADRTMFAYFKNAYNGFWDESHWLPPGYNWSSLKSTEFEHYPHFADLRLPIYYAFAFLVARMIFEW